MCVPFKTPSRCSALPAIATPYHSHCLFPDCNCGDPSYHSVTVGIVNGPYALSRYLFITHCRLHLSQASGCHSNVLAHPDILSVSSSHFPTIYYRPSILVSYRTNSSSYFFFLLRQFELKYFRLSVMNSNWCRV